MKQEERRQLVNMVLMATMKARSNMLEIFGKDDIVMLSVLADIRPLVMSTDHPLAIGDMPPLMAMCNKMLDKSEIEGIDIYNLVFVALKDVAVNIIMELWGRPLPELSAALIKEED